MLLTVHNNHFETVSTLQKAAIITSNISFEDAPMACPIVCFLILADFVITKKLQKHNFCKCIMYFTYEKQREDREHLVYYT